MYKCDNNINKKTFDVASTYRLYGIHFVDNVVHNQQIQKQHNKHPICQNRSVEPSFIRMAHSQKVNKKQQRDANISLPVEIIMIRKGKTNHI